MVYLCVDEDCVKMPNILVAVFSSNAATTYEYFIWSAITLFILNWDSTYANYSVVLSLAIFEVTGVALLSYTTSNQEEQVRCATGCMRSDQ